MKLKINNFAKIKEADIIVDGITVIAGENNTGKSTVGKILFSLFNSLSDIESKIKDERMKEMELTNRIVLQNYSDDANIPRNLFVRNTYSTARGINRGIQKELKDLSAFSKDDMENIIRINLQQISDVFDEDGYIEKIAEELADNINEILLLPEEAIVREVISGYFNNVFHGQINSISEDSNADAVLGLEIKGKKNEVTFCRNTCISHKEAVSITHKAIYIDTPFVIDELSTYNELSPMNEALRNLLTDASKDDFMDGIIEKMRAKEKLNEILQALSSVVDGEVVVGKNNDEYFFKTAGFSEPVSFHNLSTGIKSFMVLKMLIENGCLKEKDVLVLDEPEIHLHPQWQIAYAELIVLLQKKFDLSVIVTTHSPYFMDAVNLFSCKYEIENRVNYYLSSNAENKVMLENVTEKIESIYQKMASPIQELETLRYELNNK